MENLGEFKVFEGLHGVAKGFCDILPQLCMSVLWHTHVKGAVKIVHVLKGDCKIYLRVGGRGDIFTITEHFTLPTIIVDNTLI